MAKNLVILIHKTNGSIFHTSSKTDLSTILGVSLSTVIRKYSNAGVYKSIDYDIIISSTRYESGKETHYNRNVEPPIVKTYDNIQRHEKPNNVVKMTNQDRFIEQPIEEMPVYTDWRILEKNLSISEYDKYYSGRSLNELTDSANYFKFDTIRMKYIRKYGALRQLD